MKLVTAENWRRWTGPWIIAHLGEKGTMQLNGVKRKENTSQIKPYVSRKRQLSECDSEGRDAQGEAPVKRRRRPESSATTNNGMHDNNLEDGNLEITGFVKHAESMEYKPPCSEWQQGKCNQLNLKLKRNNGSVQSQQPGAVTIDHKQLIHSIVYFCDVVSRID